MKLLTRDEYYKLLRGTPPNVCLFCRWHDKQIVLAESKYWVWMANLAPYWKFHTMFIPKRHIEDIDLVNEEEFIDLKGIKSIAVEQYKKAKIISPSNTEADLFLYFWKVRNDGFDSANKVTKSTHLHIHMVPDNDNSWIPILDPSAIEYEIELLKIKKDS
jgi:diadenosine tetraphosphate (Ap4A) HIT family hydrolase